MSNISSTIDLFTVGIGPSSSHTVGPMKAARRFIGELGHVKANVEGPTRLRCELYGSLAATGKGHGTDRAIALGFMGHEPGSIDPDRIDACLKQLAENGLIQAGPDLEPGFNLKKDLVFHRTQTLPLHPNGMHFQWLEESGNVLAEEVIYSVGGGVIFSETELTEQKPKVSPEHNLPYPFKNGRQLLEQAERSGKPISAIALANELTSRSEAEIMDHLDQVWQAMCQCVERGLRQTGTLPGGLKVPRRAKKITERLLAEQKTDLPDPLRAMDWVNAWALAVNEENAAGGRVVTAPTNGAAGIIPAVMLHTRHFVEPKPGDWVHVFLLTAGAIGWLYKNNASISGADVGCQGEVGVACSMAAAGLTAVMGGTPSQIENAAEIGMEHNLGLTCDPIGGLVQIPCIERNAMGAVKAINAARLAMAGDGSHKVSLDKVIHTMRETGRDMLNKYKETARGGLAVSFVDC